MGRCRTKPFQFYDSPIKSSCQAKQSEIFFLFQFYDSPIKREANNPDYIRNLLCFNSMIVRLKDPNSQAKNKHTLRFNSMIVRLKAVLFFVTCYFVAVSIL